MAAPQAFRISMVPVPPDEVPEVAYGTSLFFLCETCWQIVAHQGWDDHVAFHDRQAEALGVLDARVAEAEGVIDEVNGRLIAVEDILPAQANVPETAPPATTPITPPATKPGK